MSVFVDTGVFFAHHDTDADRHADAVDAFDELMDGAFGQPYTNDYAFDETVTLARARTGSFEAADAVVSRVLGEDSFPQVFELVHIEPMTCTHRWKRSVATTTATSASRTRR